MIRRLSIASVNNKVAMTANIDKLRTQSLVSPQTRLGLDAPQGAEGRYQRYIGRVYGILVPETGTGQE